MEELIKRIDKLEERIYALEHKSTFISLPEDFFGGEMYIDESSTGEIDIDDTYE